MPPLKERLLDSEPEMIESFRFHSRIRVEQFGQVVNFALIGALGLLAVAGNHLIELGRTPAPSAAVLTGMRLCASLSLLSALTGVGLSVNRLYDFRWTAEVARMRLSSHYLKEGLKPVTADRKRDLKTLDCRAETLGKRVKIQGDVSYAVMWIQLLLLGAAAFLYADSIDAV